MNEDIYPYLLRARYVRTYEGYTNEGNNIIFHITHNNITK